MSCNYCILALAVVVSIGNVLASVDDSISFINMIDDDNFKHLKNVLKDCDADAETKNASLVYGRLDQLDKCFQGVVNVQKLAEDFNMALIEGTVQNVTKQHCFKVKPIHKCLTDFTTSIEHCFDEETQKNLWIMVQVINSVLEFVCHKDGLHVLFFMKYGGMECVVEHQDELQHCTVWNDTDDFNISSATEKDFLKRIVFDENNCRKLLGISDCLFVTLKQCEDRTPSLLMKALTKDVFKDTPCWTYVSSALAIRNFTLLSLLLVLISFLHWHNYCT